MSSPRPGLATNAIVTHGDRGTGPLALPEKESERFIEEFNRTYASIGLSVTIHEDGKTQVLNKSDADDAANTDPIT